MGLEFGSDRHATTSWLRPISTLRPFRKNINKNRTRRPPSLRAEGEAIQTDPVLDCFVAALLAMTNFYEFCYENGHPAGWPPWKPVLPADRIRSILRSQPI